MQSNNTPIETQQQNLIEEIPILIEGNVSGDNSQSNNTPIEIQQHLPIDEDDEILISDEETESSDDTQSNTDTPSIDSYNEKQAYTRSDGDESVPETDNQTDTTDHLIIHAESKTYIHKYYVEKLKQYQIDAVRFMFNNCIVKNSGCIIAHSMGLGKTISTIAFLHTIANSNSFNIKKVLILTQKSIVKQFKEPEEK